jgi:hypothetical protein
MDSSYAWLLLGLLLVVVGLFLIAEFVFHFAKLIAGLLLLVVGLQLIGWSRRPRIRMR